MAGCQPSVRGEEQVGVIQRGSDGVPLADADADPGTGLPSGPPQQLRLRAGDQDGIVVVPFPVLAAAFVPVPHGEAEGHAKRITGNEQLREHDQFRLEPGGFQDQRDGFFHAGVLPEQKGGGLDHGHPAGGLEVLHSGCSFPGNPRCSAVAYMPSRRRAVVTLRCSISCRRLTASACASGWADWAAQ